MIKNYLKDKDVGFWFSASLILLSLLTSIVYVSCYAGTDNMNWASFAFMLLAAVSGAILIAFKQYKFAPYALGAFIFVSLLFFIYGIYYYVSVVMVGIDLDKFDPEFIVCLILYLIAFAAGIANIFLRQIKKENKTEEAGENE